PHAGHAREQARPLARGCGLRAAQRRWQSPPVSFQVSFQARACDVWRGNDARARSRSSRACRLAGGPWGDPFRFISFQGLVTIWITPVRKKGEREIAPKADKLRPPKAAKLVVRSHRHPVGQLSRRLPYLIRNEPHPDAP